MNPPRRLLNFARQMGAWSALDGRRKTFAIFAAAVALISVLYALNIRTVFFGPHAVTAIDDIGEGGGGGARFGRMRVGRPPSSWKGQARVDAYGHLGRTLGGR